MINPTRSEFPFASVEPVHIKVENALAAKIVIRETNQTRQSNVGEGL